MINNLFLRGTTVFVAILLMFGLVMPAHAQSSTILLEDAYATLASAKHDYKGHRVKAMKQIEEAFNESGWKIKGTGKNHEPQGTSDAQMRSAASLLQQARGGLSAKAVKHVDKAIAQINDGLEVK